MILRQYRIFGILIFVTIICVRINSARAGGWYSADKSSIQTDMEVVYLVDGSRVTAIYHFGYKGDGQKLVWIIPVPARPESFGEFNADWQGHFFDSFAFDPLPMKFSIPPKYCDYIFWPNFMPERYGSGGDQTGYPVIDRQALLTASEIAGWLESSNYKINDNTQQIIKDYANKGMFFVVVEMHQDAPYGVSPVYAVTYKADELLLPLRLIATSAEQHMPVQIWIMGHTRYVSQNTINAKIDFAKLHAPSRVMNPYMWFSDHENSYFEERSKIIATATRQTLVTEYAGSSNLLAPNQESLQALKQKYPYLTKLYTEISPGKSEDPIFKHGAAALDVSNFIDLNRYVDPLEYWGCSTRSVEAQIGPLNDLPDSRIKLLGINVSYPNTWVLSVFDISLGNTGKAEDRRKVFVLSPKAVTKPDFESALNTKIFSLPMFVVAELQQFSSDRLSSEFQPFYFGLHPDRSIDRFLPGMVNKGIMLALLTSNEDWASHETLYRSMLNYANVLPYYLHPELRYSLFLDDVSVGFPEGWREQVNGSDVIIKAADGDAQVRIRQIASLLTIKSNTQPENFPARLLKKIDEEYNVETKYLQRFIDQDESCNVSTQPIFFVHHGRVGYLRLRHQLKEIVEVSTTEKNFEKYKRTLSAIIDSVKFSQPCG
jgi:hypothetical protein